MEGSHAATCRDQRQVGVLAVHKWDNFVYYVLFVKEVPVHFIFGLTPIAIEAFYINAINTINLKFAMCYPVANIIKDFPIFVVVKTGASGWKKYDRLSGVSKD
jgi:hypothetical protein